MDPQVHAAPDRGASGSVLSIDLLRVEAGAPGLPDELRRQGLQPRSFERAEEWLQALASEVPAVLLATAQAVPAASELLNSLALKDPRFASVLLVACGSLEQRLPSLLSGADLFIDDLNDPRLGARLSNWIRDQDRAPFRVLVIDDDAEGRQYATTILGKVGMQVEAYDDAEAAIRRVADFRPDLVLLDLYMPGLDGLAVTQRLRAEAPPMLPIVFLSGEERPEARFNALRLGADEFLVKPVRPRALIAAVRSRIKRARGLQRRFEAGAADSGPRLRRGDFLQLLQQRQEMPDQGLRVLMALRVDAAAELRERLGLAAAHALERQLAEHLRVCLGPADRFSLWEEFGFGLLVERSGAEEVQALVQRLLQGLPTVALGEGSELRPLSFSIGLALPNRAKRDYERWIASAFAALSVAAQLGGGRAEGVLSRDPDALPPERELVIRLALKDLSRSGSLRFEFQPLLRLRGERACYALIAKLRDPRAPLQGYPRSEFLALARAQGQLGTIDRMALFNAFEAVAEQRQRGHRSGLLVPLDLESVDARQLAWLEAELRRRPELLEDLWLELDAELLLRAEHTGLIERLQAAGVALAAAARRPDPGVFEALVEAPIRLLRVPHALVLQTPATELAQRIGAWHEWGRELLVDRVESMSAVGDLWNLGVDYLQGDALAAASPRLDFEGEPSDTH